MLGGGYFDGSNQVFLSVRAQGSDRQLRTGKDNRLREVFEHEAERRCRIRHRVGAVQDDKAVKVIVVIIYDFDNLGPQRRFHIRGVDGRVELIGRDAVVEAFQFGDMLEQVVEIEIFQCAGFRVFHHSDSSACVN